MRIFRFFSILFGAQTLVLSVGCSATQVDRAEMRPPAGTQSSKSTAVNSTSESSSGQTPSETNNSSSGSLSPQSTELQNSNNPNVVATPRDKLKSGGAIYTEASPGIYADKVATHLSQLNITKTALTISINHEMIKSSYIRWVQLRTVQGDILFEKEFAEPQASATPGPAQKFTPLTVDLSTMGLKQAQILYVYSSCGDHGIWRAETQVP